MTSNQDGRQAAIRASTGTTGQAVEDWHALFDDAGIAAGPFNARMLAWINAELGTSYTNLNGAMWAYADNAGYDRWNAIATLVLAVSGAEELAGSEANALALDFTDDYHQSGTGFYGSAYILDAGTPANDYNSSPVTEAASLLSYAGSSPKLTMGPSVTLRYNAHNLYLNSASPANQSITVVSGASYAVTITGSVSVTASGAATATWTAGTNTFTAATTTLTLGSTSGSGTVHVYRTPADTTYLETTSAARYGLPYEWTSAGVLRGVRVEPAATNVCAQNVVLTTSSGYWSTATINTTNTLVSDQAPFAHGGVYNLVANSSTAIHRHYRATLELTIPQNQSGTISCYVKANGFSRIFLRESHATGAGCGFDLAAGTAFTPYSVASMTASNPTITDVGNDWYRVSVTFTALGASRTCAFGLHIAPDTYTSGDIISQTFAGDDAKGVLWALPQTEAGSVATSVIETFGATATRAADVATRAVTGYPHSATVNSGLVQFVPLNAAAATAVIQLDDGTSNEVVSIGYDASANIGLTVTDGGAAQTAPLADGTVTANATETIGFSWKANDFLLSDNGATAVADTSGTLPTVTTLKIRASGGPILLRKLLLVPVEKTAAEVEAYGATA